MLNPQSLQAFVLMLQIRSFLVAIGHHRFSTAHRPTESFLTLNSIMANYRVLAKLTLRILTLGD